MITITVKVFNKRFQGDKSYHIEQHTIRKDCINWWKEHSGKGDFVLLDY